MSAQTKTTRRVFMMQNALASAAVLLAVDAHAQAMVSESDPQAAALGYVADTAKANGKKFPNHKASQACNGCALYQGGCGLSGRWLWHLPGQAGSSQGLVLCVG